MSNNTDPVAIARTYGEKCDREDLRTVQEMIGRIRNRGLVSDDVSAALVNVMHSVDEIQEELVGEAPSLVLRYDDRQEMYDLRYSLSWPSLIVHVSSAMLLSGFMRAHLTSAGCSPDDAMELTSDLMVKAKNSSYAVHYPNAPDWNAERRAEQAVGA